MPAIAFSRDPSVHLRVLFHLLFWGGMPATVYLIHARLLMDWTSLSRWKCIVSGSLMGSAVVAAEYFYRDVKYLSVAILLGPPYSFDVISGGLLLLFVILRDVVRREDGPPG